MSPRDLFEKCTAFTRHHHVKELGLYPYFRPLAASEGSRVTIEGKPRIMLGSNNYLGLTHHPDVVAAAKQAIDDFGTGCTGSRMLNGTLDLHVQLENELADYLNKESVLLWSTGFMSNSGSVGTLCGRKDLIFADREDHASLVDGFLLSGSRLVRFKHNDVADLERRLKQYEDHQGARLIAVDGVYSMTGEIAPLPELVDLAERYNARILVDEAHAVGTIGPGGRGTVAHFDLNDRVDLISGTFSKTFGSMGGFLAGPQSVKDFLMHHSRQLMYTASFTPSVAATVLASLRIIRAQPELVEAVRANARWMRRVGRNGLQLPSFRLGGRSGGHWTRRANAGVQPTYFRRRHFCQSRFTPCGSHQCLFGPNVLHGDPRSKRPARSAGYLFSSRNGTRCNRAQ